MRKTLSLLLIIIVTMIGCFENSPDMSTETNQEERIVLNQKGVRLPIDSVSISWETNNEGPRAVNNAETFFAGRNYPLLGYEAYYANNIKETRKFYFPDNTFMVQFKFGGAVFMRGGDKVIFHEGPGVNNSQIVEYDGYQSKFGDHVRGPFMSVGPNENIYGAKIEFVTNSQGGYMGWGLKQVDVTYDVKLPRRYYNYPIYKNVGHDLIMRESGDVIQFRVQIDRNKDHLVHLLHASNKNTSDFDVYIKGGSSLNPENASQNNYDFSGVKGTWVNDSNEIIAVNEAVPIPKDYYDSGVDTLYVSVVSHKGEGHARLFINETKRLTVSLGLKKPINYSPIDPSWWRGFLTSSITERSDVFSAISRRLYESTDGQYLIDKFQVYTDNCPGFCFAYLVPKRSNPVDRSGRYYGSHFTVETFTPDGTLRSSESLANTFAHEYGHELGLADQYDGDGNPTSGHSIMIGSTWASYANIKDFSYPHSHGRDPIIRSDGSQDPETLVGQLSNWQELSNTPDLFKPISSEPSFQSYKDPQWCFASGKFHLQDVYFQNLIDVEIMEEVDFQNGNSMSVGTYSYQNKCEGLTLKN